MMLLFFTAALIVPRGDVARIGPKVVAYAEIRCDEEQLELLNASGGRASRDCHEVEQRRLDIRITRDLVDFGAEKLHADVRRADVERRMAAAGMDKEFMNRLVRISRVMPSAVSEVLKGGDSREVWQKLLSPGAGTGFTMSEAQFLRIVSAVGTAQRAADLLNGVSIEHTRDDLMTAIRRELLAERVYKAMADGAAREGVPFERFADQFWRDAVSEMRVEILDSAYRLPDLRRIP